MKQLENSLYSVGKKPPTPILCVTEKMEQNRNKIASIFFKNYQVLCTCRGRFHKPSCKLWGDSVEKVILYDFLRFIFNVFGENSYLPNYDS